MDLNKQESIARPSLGRAFLSMFAKNRLPTLQAHLVYWVIFTGGTALDLWTKAAIFNWLCKQHYSKFSLIDGFINLVPALNDGAAFGIASGQRLLLTIVAVVALIGGVLIFLFSGTKHRLVHIAMGLFSAGVCGNLYDRIFNDGMVRDFIDVVYWQGKHWPAFNLADTMLCVAAGLLILSAFLTERSSQKHAQQQK